MGKTVIIYLIVSSGYLSSNPTLYWVGVRRQWDDVALRISHETRITDYECVVGLPGDLRELLGKEVFFRDHRGLIYGPWLTTDVENGDHSPYMRKNNLAGDVICQPPLFDRFVHEQGDVLVKIIRKETRH